MHEPHREPDSPTEGAIRSPVSTEPSGEAMPSVADLVSLYHADVYRYALHLTGQVAEAEDLSQETFLSATRSLGQLREAERAKQWLLRIVRNRFLKQLQRKRPTAAANIDLDMETIPGDAVSMDLDVEQLHRSLQELPEEYRVVILMHYFEFLPYQEIANELDLPMGTVMSRLARAKDRLRAKFGIASDS